MKKTLYALQGVFFQKNWGMGTAIDPLIGVRATITSQLQFTMFHGLVGKEPMEENFSGMMNDRYGDAALTDFVLTDTEMSFTKKYLKRNDPIRYEFKEKKDGIWYGTWSGPAVGAGTAKCIVNETNELFFAPINAEDVKALEENYK